MFGSRQPDHRPLSVVGDLQGPIANDQSGHAPSSATRANGATRVVVSLDGRRNSLATIDCTAVQPQSKSGHVWCQARCAMQSAWSVISDAVPYKALALLVFWILGLHEVGRGQQNDFTCEASFGFHAYPTFDAPQWSMGMPLQSGQAYDELNRRVLAPVPMAVWVASDSDLVTGYCEGADPTCGGGRYRQEAIMGFLDTSWEIDPLSTTGSCGAFMNEMGLTEESGAGGGPLSPILTRDDQSVVLFVPPSDLNCNETRNFKIRAIVWESRQAIAPGLIDGATALEFDVEVKCTPQRTYDIRISKPTSSPLPAILNPEQADGAGYCGASFAYSQSSPIAGNVAFNDKIGVGDIRPLVATYLDQDGVTLRCGEGGGGCFGLSDPHAYHSALSYEWEFVGTPPAGVELLAGTTDKQVALLSIDSTITQGCELEVKLTVKDIGPALAHDGNAEKFIKIRVFTFAFIDQNSAALPREALRTAPKDLDSACFGVSELPTYEGMNNPGNATWADLPTTPDSRLFRFEVDSTYAGAEDVGSVDVRLTRRPQPGNNVSPTFDHSYTGKNQADSVSGPPPFRVFEHIRLVSNANDDTPVAPFEDYQTIRVQLGDRLRAQLLVDGDHVTFIELPVGTPPIGSQANSNAQNTIKTLTTRWIVVDLFPSASPSITLSTERMCEDLAQVNVRVRNEPGGGVVYYRRNNLLLLLPSAPTHDIRIAGTILVDGVTVGIDVLAAKQSDLVEMARLARQAIAAQITAPTGRAVRTANYGDYGIFVVDPGQDVQLVPNLTFTYETSPIPTPVPPTEGFIATHQPAWYGSGYPFPSNLQLNQELDLYLLAMNYSDCYAGASEFDAGAPGAESIDIYVLPHVFLLVDKLVAHTTPWHNVNLQARPAMCGTTFVRVPAVDADDSLPTGWWPAISHEMIHHFDRISPTAVSGCTDQAVHVTSDLRHLMARLPPGVDHWPDEAWDGPKRLPSTCCHDRYRRRGIRSSNSGNRAPQLLFERCE